MRPERYRAIAAKIANDIRTGALPAGTRLPTHRDLARRYGVALATATKVYGELTRAYVMDEPERRRLVDIARRHDCVVIEDATYAFLQPSSPPALYTLAPERTCHIGSLSKNLATGLRYGHLVAPPAHRDALTRVLRASWGTSAVVAAMATRMLGDGTVDRMQKLRRDDARRRQHIATAELKELGYQANTAAYLGVAHTAGRHPRRHRGASHRLADGGVLVSTADAFTVTPHAANALRVALASPPLDELAAALRTLWDAVRLV